MVIEKVMMNVTCLPCPNFKKTECKRKRIIKNLVGLYSVAFIAVGESKPPNVFGMDTFTPGKFYFEEPLCYSEGYTSCVGRAKFYADNDQEEFVLLSYVM